MQVVGEHPVRPIVEHADQVLLEAGGVGVEQLLDVGRWRRAWRRCTADRREIEPVQPGVAAARDRLLEGLRRFGEAPRFAQQAAALGPHLGPARVDGEHPVAGGERLIVQAQTSERARAQGQSVAVVGPRGEHGVGCGDRLDRSAQLEPRRGKIEQGRRAARHRSERGDEQVLCVFETSGMECGQTVKEQLLR